MEDADADLNGALRGKRPSDDYHQPQLPDFHHHLARDAQHLSSETTNHSAPQFAADARLVANAHRVPNVESNHAFTPVNPDDFYKSYRAIHVHENPDLLPMPSSSRTPLPPNGDVRAPRYPTPTSSRSPNARAASNPVAGRTATVTPRGYNVATSSTVRDLTKRFDQQNATEISAGSARAHAQPGAATRGNREFALPNTQGSTSYSSMRAGASSGPAVEVASGVSPHHSHRAKFVAEDQVSNNSQSFASRIGKPRSSPSRNPIAARAMHHPQKYKSHFTHQAVSPTSSSLSRSHGLLFGEILPDQRYESRLGHGIDSSVQSLGLSPSPQGQGGRQRSFSNPDIEPSSPDGWSRAHEVGPAHGHYHGQSHPTKSGHSRSQSDATAPKPTNASHQAPKPPKSSTSTSRLPTSASKLPVSVRMLSSPTTSPPSTRSNSPPTSKQPTTNGKTLGPSSTIPRAKAAAPRAKTPIQGTPRRKQPPSALATSHSSTRLQAHNAHPPPKTSPPLRSSRPRQPVSMASTASSRMKLAERAKSPFGPGGQMADTTQPAPPRRRKISIGPIDFEQRREHIRLAYTKSIRENQALEARQRAADRRRKELEDAARAKAKAAKAAAAEISALDTADSSPIPPIQSPTVAPDVASDDERGLVEPHVCTVAPVDAINDKALEAPGPAESATSGKDDKSARQEPVPLRLSTSNDGVSDVSDSIVTQNLDVQYDSPTLGVPGSFPAMSPPIEFEEPPMSAVSATSGVTEFDAEPQTNPPVHDTSALGISVKNEPPGLSIQYQPRRGTEYHDPFEDDVESPNLPSSAHDTSSNPNLFSTPHDPTDGPQNAVTRSYDLRPDEEEIPLVVEPEPAQSTIIPSGEPGRLANEQQRDTSSFPRLEPLDESECDSEEAASPNRMHEKFNEDITDTCSADETDDLEDRGSRVEDSASGDDPHFSQRASTCASTDFEEQAEMQYSSCDDSSVRGAPNELPVPGSNRDRSSNQSGWTDYTVDSMGLSNATASQVAQSSQSPSYGHVTIFESQGPDRKSGQSIERSMFDGSDIRPSTESNRSTHLQPHQHQFSDLSIGSGPNSPSLQNETDSRPYGVHHSEFELPPIPRSTPVSAVNSRRTSSLFYDQSHQGSTLLNSERGSEDYLSQLETPQSFDISSLGTPEYYAGSTTPAELELKVTGVEDTSDGLGQAERDRLIQRRNVIKELVDTEAVFVRDMNIVEEIYKGTAEACPELDASTVKLIFRNTDEIIELHTSFLGQIKDAVASVYVPKVGRSLSSKDTSTISSDSEQSRPVTLSDDGDRATCIGPLFQTNMEKLKLAHEAFLRNSDHAAKKLIEIQRDSTVKVWLNECNEVAKELTAAWDLDSLLIKPMQRITKYPNLIITLLQHTPQDHPDRQDLVLAKENLETAILEINKTKKNFELVGQIVGRKRKESDVKAGFARAFGKRVDKLQTSGNRPAEDAVYAKLNERFGDDYLRLQVVLRDVEFYTRQVSAYVHEFLQYLSSIELVMRLQPGSYPEIESKWVQFNISARDLQKVALEEHLAQVRKHVIEPFELVIKSYGNPSLAMKKRQKRRVDYERQEQLKRAGKSIDSRLQELVDQYEALNDTLKQELPKLSALTEKVGNICLGNFVNIQANWYRIWTDKMKVVLGDCDEMPDMDEVVATFNREHPFAQEQLNSLGILNPAYRGRASQSTAASADDSVARMRPRLSDIETRGRGRTSNSDFVPSLPTPDFGRQNSGSFSAISPPVFGSGAPSPHHYHYKDYYSGLQATPGSTGMVASPEIMGSSRSVAETTAAASTRPSTGRSLESGAMPRQSSDSAAQPRPDSNTTYDSNYPSQEHRRYSGLFHSALPLPDGEERVRSSRASSRERVPDPDGYNVLWLAASLFEFNINTTKHEAGYPYLLYQAGEIFDVIAEKGELWLAKNQDDPNELVGWIWSKHFAKLADA